MAKKVLLLTPLILMLLFSGCKSSHEKFAEQGIHRMSSTQLKTLLQNGWNVSFEIKSVKGDVDYKPDGSASGQWSGSSHQGTWNVDDNKLCSKWDTGSRCYYLYQTEPGEFTAMNMDGSIRGRLFNR